MKELDLNKKKRILIIMIVIGLLLILIIGAALAYMAPNINNTETSSTIVFNSGIVAIVYENGENQINAKDVLPGWTAIKEFSVTAKNNTEIDASDVMNYALKLVVEKNTFSSGAITYKLEGVNVDNNGTLAYILPNKLNSGASKINLGYGTFEQTDALIKGVTHKYTLTLAFPNKTYESQSSDMGKQLSAYITVEKPSELAKLTITDAEHNINNLTINVEKNVEFDLSNPGYANNQLFSSWKVNTGTASIKIGSQKITVSSDEASVSSNYYTTLNFDYSDDHTWSISFFAPYTGIYKLEAWGASGGSSTATGGYGAYATGNIMLKKGQAIDVYVGGQGSKAASSVTPTSGGYNGGGSSYYAGGTGGGATHFSFEDSLLNETQDKSKLILVAAGGGGGGNYSANNKGGSGGGIIGVDGGYYNASNKHNGTGGTQTFGGIINSSTVAGKNGTFGYGGDAGYNSGNKQGAGAGGGGYYGGGGGSNRNGGGGGGSSFIGSNHLIDDGNKVMYCYNCTESSEASTKTISTSNYSSDAVSNYAKQGNGYARITIQTIEEDAEYSTITVVNEEYQTVTTIETKKGNKINIPVESNPVYEFDKYEIEKGTATIDGTNVTPTSDILVIKVKYKEKNTYELAYVDPTTENAEPYYEFKATKTGTYKIETWGAQGGYGSDETKYYGGYGGYSTGNIHLKSGETLYIVIGGKGNSATAKAAAKVLGGYNGGGSGFGNTDKYVSGGGGATHIAKKSGNLTLFENDLENLLIVAAGGGGGAFQTTSANGIGGSGGGFNGVKSTPVGSYTSTGATQTSSGKGYYPGKFGLGGCNATANGCSGGGGGLYGGDAARYYGGGAGGSSYIANNNLTDKVMYCFGCEESSDSSTKTVATTCHSETPTSNCAKEGNGYARITYIS